MIWRDYQIQKMTADGWIKAWGYNPRTFPKTHDDAEAIAIFRNETAQVRTRPHRLLKLGGPSKAIAILDEGELKARREAALLEAAGKCSVRPSPKRRRL